MNGFPNEMIMLLQSWREQVSANENTHRMRALYFRMCYYSLGTPAAILSGLVSVSSLYNLSNCVTWFCIFQAVASSLATILVTVQSYGNVMTRFNNHKLASDRYQALLRTIDTYLVTKNKIKDVSNIMNNIRMTFDDIVTSSPLLGNINDTKLDFSLFGKQKRELKEKIEKNKSDELEEIPDKNTHEHKINEKSEIDTIIDIRDFKKPFTVDPLFQYHMDRFLDESVQKG